MRQVTLKYQFAGSGYLKVSGVRLVEAVHVTIRPISQQMYIYIAAHCSSMFQITFKDD